MPDGVNGRIIQPGQAIPFASLSPSGKLQALAGGHNQLGKKLARLEAKTEEQRVLLEEQQQTIARLVRYCWTIARESSATQMRRIVEELDSLGPRPKGDAQGEGEVAP